MLTVAWHDVETGDVRRRRKRLRPEGLGSLVPLGYGDLPVARMQAEDLLQGGRRYMPAPVFPCDEELAMLCSTPPP